MLLFNNAISQRTNVHFYLKTSYVIVQRAFMLHILHHLAEFKNILCYCSTERKKWYSEHNANLKTSYVIVQRTICSGRLSGHSFKNILCYCSTIAAAVSSNSIPIFKNILCYCSTATYNLADRTSDLKTSYVIVQPA